ncbi:unnamed protein product [Ixodes pacificus]
MPVRFGLLDVSARFHCNMRSHERAEVQKVRAKTMADVAEDESCTTLSGSHANRRPNDQGSPWPFSPTETTVDLRRGTKHRTPRNIRHDAVEARGQLRATVVDAVLHRQLRVPTLKAHQSEL